MALRLPRPECKLVISDLDQALEKVHEHSDSSFVKLTKEETDIYGRVINSCRHWARQMARQHFSSARNQLAANPQNIARTLRNDSDALIELERRFFFSIFPQEITARIIVGSKPFIIDRARKYSALGMLCEFQDLISAGIMGALEAIRFYDYETGNCFLTYADDWIEQYIKREITERSYRSYARLPEDVSVLRFHVSEFIEKFRLQHGRPPRAKEIIKQNFRVNGRKLTMQTLKLLLKFMHTSEPKSIEEIDNDVEERHASREDLLALVSQDSSPEDRLIAREELEEQLKRLEEDYRLIEEAIIAATIAICLKTTVRGRKNRLEVIARERIFGRNDDHDHTMLKEVGHRFGIERERVRQEEEKLLMLASRVTGFSSTKIRTVCLQMNRLREIQAIVN